MKSEKRMALSFFLNFFFTIFEFIGGILTNSIALLSDAVHDLGDSISMGVAIFLEKKSKKAPDQKYTYGYNRFSLLGGMITSVVLIIGSTIIIIETIKRLLNPQPIDAELMIYFAIIGVIVNGLAAFNASKGKSINEKVISLHLLEDVFGWIVLLIGAILMNIFDFQILDAILSLLFTVFIIYHVFRNLKSILEIFLEKAPKGYSQEKIIAYLEGIDNVDNIHHIHLWSIEGNVPMITLHAKISKDVSVEESALILKQIQSRLHSLGIKHTTIQLEFFDNECDDIECNDIEVDDKHHGHIH